MALAMHPFASPTTNLVGIRLANGGNPSMAVRTCSARDDSSALKAEVQPTMQWSGALVDYEGSRAMASDVGCQLLPSGCVKSMEGVTSSGASSQTRVQVEVASLVLFGIQAGSDHGKPGELGYRGG